MQSTADRKLARLAAVTTNRLPAAVFHIAGPTKHLPPYRLQNVILDPVNSSIVLVLDTHFTACDIPEYSKRPTVRVAMALRPLQRR